MASRIQLAALVLTLAAAAHAQPPASYPSLPAQDPAFKDLPRAQQTELRQKTERIQTFAILNSTQPNDGNEILTGLRLMFDPAVKMYLLPSQNYMVVQATPDELALAGKLIAEWDRPRKTYRLTYTLTERDAGKVIGIQRVTLDLIAGQRTTLKNGDKIPVITGDFKTESASTQSQFTYLDIGLNFQATLQDSSTGAVLNSVVEQSEVGDEKNLRSTDDPIIRQTKIEGAVTLTPGKATNIGSLDRVGTTRHLDVDVTLEPTK